MLKEKAKLIILQKNENILTSIERFVRFRHREGTPNDVSYLVLVNDVLASVRSGAPSVVVTGDYFHQTGSYFNGFDCDGSPIEEVIRNASSLGRAVRLSNPDTMVIRYSAAPKENNEYLAGDIDKDNISASMDTLVKLAGHEDLADMLRAHDWNKMRKEFPGINFYDDFLKTAR